MPALVFHIDMDAFFAAVEKRDKPELENKPLIIGANPKEGRGRGVVSTCCYIARKYGVHSAMPISTAYRLCPTAVFLRPDMEKYKLASEGIMAVFASFADSFQPVSIDEAYLDVSQKVREYPSARDLAVAIKEEVFRAERLTCSIGISTSKSVAKIASDMKKPNGITEVLPGREAQFLAPLPIGKICGIGKKSVGKYLDNGINTVGDLAAANEDFLRERIGDVAVGFKYVAMGIDNRQVLPYTGMESISRETTFMRDVDDEPFLLQQFRELARLVHSYALRHRRHYRTIGIKVRFENYTTFTRERSFPVAVRTLDAIVESIELLWREFSPPPKKLRLIGVRLSGLEKGGFVQTTLDDWLMKGRGKGEQQDKL